MLKNKKALWIALAVVVLVALFLTKNTSIFKNKETYGALGKENGLDYNTVALGDLINKDTDMDGVLDWEEGLWGTDPTKKETTEGVNDKVAIEKLKAEQAKNGDEKNKNKQIDENLTQTDNFSRELFATVASLTQNGEVDDATIQQLSDSLAERISNPSIKKVFSSSEIKISASDGPEATENYLIEVDNLYSKIPKGKSVTDILKEFANDGENVNVAALSKLDPVIKNLSEVINGMLKISVPKNLAQYHLSLINTLESLKENISDMKLFDIDPVVAMGAIINYQKNIDVLLTTIEQLGRQINQ